MTDFSDGVRPTAITTDIAREVIDLHRSQLGRGPTEAKTLWSDDLVVCVLRDGLTKPERVLLDAGRFDQVQAGREILSAALAPLMRRVVGEATGREVVAYMSQVSPTGVICEVFLLAS